MEIIYDVTTEELRNAVVSDAVMRSFYEHHATLRELRKTAVDHAVGHISLVFELVFAESIRIVKEQGCLERLLNFESDQPKTAEQFAAIRQELTHYLQERTTSECIQLTER